MSNYEQRKSNTGLYIILVVIVLALGMGAGFYFMNNGENVFNSIASFMGTFKNTVITKENYDEVMNKIEENLNDEEELYYLSYAMLYHITRDGFASAFSGEDNEDAMYVNIYGKTVGELIDEGKQLMKDNDMTIEKYKEQLNNINNE